MNIFEKAKEAAKYSFCNGCNTKKEIKEFKKGNKYCTCCPFVEENKKKYEKPVLKNNI